MTRRMRDTVVKVQAPLSGGDDRLLVYAEGRRMLQLMAPPAPVLAALAGDPKGYFAATWEGRERGWNIGPRLDDEHW